MASIGKPSFNLHEPDEHTLAILESRTKLRQWIIGERVYADSKYPIKTIHESHMAADGIEWWEVFLMNYYGRARTLGLDTERGRQALGKMITTAMDCLETAIRVYGELPPPGAS